MAEEPIEQPTQDVTQGPVVLAPRRGRRRLVKVLLVLASILAFVSIFSVWVERQALDTNEWVSTSGQFLQNDTIRTAVGNYLVDQLYDNVNVKKQIGNILPGGVKKFAGPASAGLRQVAGSAADKILQTSTAQSLWETANRDAHEQLLAVLYHHRGELAARQADTPAKAPQSTGAAVSPSHGPTPPGAAPAAER